MKPATSMPMGMSMPMSSPMSMPMPVPMMEPMPCHMTCNMTDKGMMCTITKGDGVSMDMMKDTCNMMSTMMQAGTPCMMMCCGMPMMSCCGMPMAPEMTMEMTGQGMSCLMKPKGMMTMDMLKTCCDVMTKMMGSGVPMTMMCGSMPMMVCTR